MWNFQKLQSSVDTQDVTLASWGELDSTVTNSIENFARVHYLLFQSASAGSFELKTH